jgi:hypothetical protein
MNMMSHSVTLGVRASVLNLRHAHHIWWPGTHARGPLGLGTTMHGWEEGNGDGDVGRVIAKASCGAGAWGDLDRGEDERDAAEKIGSHALSERDCVIEAGRARVLGWCRGRRQRRRCGRSRCRRR